MNTLYTQYVNEVRTQHSQQALQQEAAIERTRRPTRREQPEEAIRKPRPSYARRLVRALATLL